MSGQRIALVTGGSRGIGRACAVALAAAGHRVAVLYGHDDEGAAETVAACGGDAAAVVAVKADVSDPAAVNAAFDQVEKAWDGRVTVLVSNAGINRDGLVLRMSDDQWDAVVRTNLTGAFHCVRRASASMVRSRWGRIVTVSSVAALSGSAGQVNYAAAKAGLVGMTRSVARELASRQITANVVAPGPIATAMTDVLDEGQRDAMLRATPLGRFGTSEEVAAVVAFLCSDVAAYVTGAVIAVDGGMGMGH